MWSPPEPRTYTCPSCGVETFTPGECGGCRTRTPYQRGYDAANFSFKPRPLPRLNIPPLDTYRTYQDGYRDGLHAQGRSGPDGFSFSGS